MDSKTFFFHGTTNDGYRFTIAGIISTSLLRKAKLSLGMSVCSEKDPFTKKKGRLIAEGRMECLRPITSGRKQIKMPIVLHQLDNLSKEFANYASQYSTMSRNLLLKEFSL